MSVELLTSEQKSALINLFTFVARADGKLDGKEWHYLNRFCEAHGLTYDINQEYELRALCAVFLTEKSKMTALVETVKMALSDLDYDEREQQGLKEIAYVMEISDEKFEELNQWAIQGLAWVKKGAELVNCLPY